VAPSICFADPILRLATSRNLVVAAWSDAPEVKHLRELRTAARATRRSHPKGTALVNAIVRGTPKFTDEVRAEATELTRDDTLFALGTPHVILAPGIVGAAVRAFLGTVMIVARPGSPNKVFGDMRAALAWLETQLAAGSERWTRAELEDAAAVALG
jgi:hypothetical protein